MSYSSHGFINEYYFLPHIFISLLEVLETNSLLYLLAWPSYLLGISVLVCIYDMCVSGYEICVVCCTCSYGLKATLLCLAKDEMLKQ